MISAREEEMLEAAREGEFVLKESAFATKVGHRTIAPFPPRAGDSMFHCTVRRTSVAWELTVAWECASEEETAYIQTGTSNKHCLTAKIRDTQDARSLVLLR